MAAPEIVYVTCCDNGAFGLEHLVASGQRVSLVVTLAREVAERANVSGFCDVVPFCRRHRIRCEVLDRYVVEPRHVGAGTPDLLIVNGWNRLIAPEVIARFRYGGVGVHAGHPPIGLGRAPLPWNIIKGQRDLEVYLFRLTSQADDGDIVGRYPVEITVIDSVATLYEKVMWRAAVLIADAIEGFPGSIENAQPQDLHFAEHYGKREPKDGLIDFTKTCDQIHDFIRAQSRPYPGAFTYLDGRRWTIWKAAPFDTFSFRTEIRRPGEILLALPHGLVVATGSSPLWVHQAETAERQIVPSPLEEMRSHVGRRFAAPEKDAS
ncbi:MAG: formyltransferase family protein [Rhodococcus sp.]|nr:formyltransferase family protein [Rhodococcus sp. (in: high G+C Gram-positive bacteria)]